MSPAVTCLLWSGMVGLIYYKECRVAGCQKGSQLRGGQLRGSLLLLLLLMSLSKHVQLCRRTLVRTLAS